ncbi:MAG: DNA alkylation repair protein [Anaerolineae bacterium]|nr:DNA alkylation repair protein [Anaerolineae bacterium]
MPIDFAKNEAHYLLDQIKQHADPQYQMSINATAPTKLKVYGVRVPNLREIARAWYREHKQATCEEMLTLAESLWNNASHEERQLVTYLFEHYKNWLPTLNKSPFEHWRRGLDNWVITDSLGWLLGLWVLAEPENRLSYLEKLITDKDVWSRRLSLVATIRINRGETGFTAPDLTLQLLDQVKEERHPMMVKAVSWVLRELTRHHRDRVKIYLAENKEVLAGQVVREVNNKLQVGLKSGKAKS